MEFTSIAAAPLLAMAGTALRPVATRIAHGHCAMPIGLPSRALDAADAGCAVGRVHSGGRWQDPLVQSALAAALPTALRPALRASFEWHYCRGAHFHTDAHYGDVLFGVCLAAGPAADVVFSRGRLHRPVAAGDYVLFDPFEVHGVLRPGATQYRAADYEAGTPTVFVGFELDLTAAVRRDFGIARATAEARVISSATRVSAATGAFD